MIKTVIVEDNFVASNILKRMLENNFKDIEVSGTAKNVDEAVILINEKKPDLLFLDVELPDGNAFNVLDYVENQNFKIIFVTSHQNYAIKAIKLNALDYIVKPITKKDLIEAVEKYKAQIPNLENNLMGQELFKKQLDNQQKLTKLVLTTAQEYHIVEINDIVRCQADGYYTNVFLKSGERFLISKTLKDYEYLLEEYGFIRLHHSHLVNINYIKTFKREDGGYIIMKDEKVIPVSRRKKPALLELLSKEKLSSNN